MGDGQQQVIQLLDSIGALGLAVIVWLLLTRRLVHIKELEREISRGDRMEERLDRALQLGRRAIDVATDKMPAKE